MQQKCEVPREFGSEFHLTASSRRPESPILPRDSVLYATGRDALRALIEWGRAERGWRRWFLPDYFCQDVSAAIRATGIEVVTYRDSPLWEAPAPLEERLRQGDALFLVNYFGLRDRRAAEALDMHPADLVEDHTHDPWSEWAKASGASFCLASLRKCLPVPDGAILWSPRGDNLPPQLPATPHRETFSWMKLAAMTLKRQYLAGQDVEKEVFRQLQIRAENSIGVDDEVSGMSDYTRELLPTLPWDDWRRRRQGNFATMREALSNTAGLKVLSPNEAGDVCPFSLVLVCDTRERRERIRSHLIANDIYPSVLWLIEGNDTSPMREAAELSRRVLCLSCDFRYEASHFLRVAALVQAALAKQTDERSQAA